MIPTVIQEIVANCIAANAGLITSKAMIGFQNIPNPESALTNTLHHKTPIAPAIVKGMNVWNEFLIADKYLFCPHHAPTRPRTSAILSIFFSSLKISIDTISIKFKLVKVNAFYFQKYHTFKNKTGIVLKNVGI